MSSKSPQNESEHSHRQGSVTSLPEEEDELITTASDPSSGQQRQDTTSEQQQSQQQQRRSSSSSASSTSNAHPKVPNLDDIQSSKIEKEYQTATIDFQSVPDINNEDDISQDWNRSSEDLLTANQPKSRADSSEDITGSFTFSQQEHLKDNSLPGIHPKIDYEALVRSKQLYFDPNPELIRKPQMVAPLIYRQNITIKFLKPPPVPQGPLIIREVRPPQPPPPPPLVVRQHPPHPLPLPPIVLREKPPRVPVIMTTQVLTKTLPPLPPPPRTVVIERLPSLPPKPRDVIIERWIPYESTTQKRQIIVQRAKDFKPYPPPKNVIITYDKVEARVVHQFQQLGVTEEDPEGYAARYGNSLLDTKDLLDQARELGITQDLSPPNILKQELQQQFSSNSFEENTSYPNSNQLEQFERRSSQGSHTIDNNQYAPTYENLTHGIPSTKNYDDSNEQKFGQDHMEDLSTQLANYGLTTESIPY